MRFLRRAFVAGFLSAALSACAPPEKSITIFAASSLTDALNAVAAAYEKAGHPKPVISYAASSALARQVEQGARADVFISADEEWMDYLSRRSLINRDTRASLLGNSLVLVAPAQSTMALTIAPGFDLAGALAGGKLAMADPASVPAGKYGQASLETLGAWASVEKSVVRAENVRAALRFVETGDAAAGIVYATDAKASGDKVKVVGEFPAASHPKISYPVAELKDASADAKKFAAFLRSPAAQDIFRAQGFTIQPQPQ